MSRTAEYRIRLAQLIATPSPAAQRTQSLCYPDRHRRSDRQIAITTVRLMAATLIGVLVAIGAALKAGVR
jgi:hypothetical protein